MEHVESSRNKARGTVLRWLSYRQRSRREAELYLKRKGYSQSVIDTVVAEMMEYGYINDKLYAEEFLRSCLSRDLGPVKARYLLLSKGIEPTIIEEQLPLYFNHEEDQARARELLKKRGISCCASLKDKEMRREAQFLRCRGFCDDVIRKVINFSKNEYNI